MMENMQHQPHAKGILRWGDVRILEERPDEKSGGKRKYKEEKEE